MRLFWRWAFHRLYTLFAFTYEFVSRAVSLGHWRAWQRAVMSHLPPPDAGIVLELAHGTGDLQLDLLGAGYRSVALDLSAQMGRLARRKLARKGMTGALVRGDAMKLPLADGSMSAAVCAFPTAFILRRKCLSELERVLRPGSSAVVVMAGELDGRGPLRYGIRMLYRLTGQVGSLADDSEPHQFFGESGFLADTTVMQLTDSRAQLLVLTKPPKPTLEFPPPSWDSATVTMA